MAATNPSPPSPTVSTAPRWHAPRSAWRLTALYLLVSIVPVGLLAWTSVTFAERAVRRDTNERLKATADGAAAFLGQERQALLEIVGAYARRPTLRAALSAPEPAAFDHKVIETHLKDLLAARPGIRGTFVTRLSGVLTDVQPPTPDIVGRDFSFRDWYQGLLAKGGPYVSSAYRSAITGNSLVVAAAVFVDGAPGTRLAGQHTAIIAAAYDLAAIEGFVRDAARAQKVELSIVDHERTMLAGPGRRSDRLVTSNDPALVAATRGRSGITTLRTPSGDQIAAYRPVGGGWALRAAAPAAVVTDRVRALRQQVLTIAGVIGLVLVAGAFAFWRSQLARERLERQALIGAEHLNSVVEAAGDGFVSIDRDGAIIGWNPAAEAMFGWTESEAIGRELAELVVPPDLREAHRRGLATYLRESRSNILGQRLELRALRRDGSEFPVELVIWVLQIPGDPTFHAFIRDITTRVEHERELAAARDLATEASRLKSEFLANMSHEIRTPMNGVIGMTSLLLKTALDSEQREYAELAHNSADALLTVINDILDFSKVEAGKLEFESVEFEMRSVIEDVVELLASRAFEKGLELGVLIEPAVPRIVRGDPGRLRQVLTNLVGNAVKFTDAGEVVVSVRPVTGEGGTVVVHFEVVDTGAGIDPSAQPAIFDAFTQADASTTRRFGGTGLGLAISKRLVELMNGDIGVESAPGRGSRFWFTARFETVDDPSSLPVVLPRENLAGMRVLVIDDNATNRRILEQLLVASDVVVASAANGPDGLALLQAAHERREPFDVVALDMNMPRMDGVAVAHAIRNDPVVRSVRILLVTSSAQRGEVRQDALAGVDGYLTKPVRQGHLYDALTMLTGTRDVQEPLVTAHRLAEARRRRRPHVLIAEDNVVNQKVAVRMLEYLGYRADVAIDGMAAVEALRAEKYDAVLMDCQMPRLDGYEATREIRAMEHDAGTVRTPIIAMTASAMQGDRERCLESGMDDYVAKPLRTEELGAALDRWVPTEEKPMDEASEPIDTDGASPLPASPDSMLSDSMLSDSMLSADTLERLRVLDRRTGGSLLGQLSDMFRVDTPPRIASLHAAAAAKDAHALLQAAHSLKGSCAMIGATVMAGLCHRIESLGRDGTIEGAAELVTELDDVYEATLRELDVVSPRV